MTNQSHRLACFHNPKHFVAGIQARLNWFRFISEYNPRTVVSEMDKCADGNCETSIESQIKALLRKDP